MGTETIIATDRAKLVRQAWLVPLLLALGVLSLLFDSPIVGVSALVGAVLVAVTSGLVKAFGPPLPILALEPFGMRFLRARPPRFVPWDQIAGFRWIEVRVGVFRRRTFLGIVPADPDGLFWQDPAFARAFARYGVPVLMSDTILDCTLTEMIDISRSLHRGVLVDGDRAAAP